MSREVPRVVLDTNLVLSGLVFQSGRIAQLRMLWQGGRITPLVSKATAAELIRALGYPKFKLAAAEQEELLADYLPYCSTVALPNPPPETPKCRDPADTPFLQLALAGKADALVTGDKDLLALAEIFACPILTAERFIVQLHASL
jgi:putative PIN family toxin of toxin-antitoxin system